MANDRPAPEQEIEIARKALADNDLKHAIHHVGCALTSDPVNNDWLGLLHDIINQAGDALALVPMDSEETDFVTAATRAYILAQQGSTQDALNMIIQVVETRPDVPFLQWASWWLQQPGVAQGLPQDFVCGSVISTVLQMVGSCPCPMSGDDPRLNNVQAAWHVCGVFREVFPDEAFVPFACSVIGRRLGIFDQAMALARQAHQMDPSWRTCVGMANIFRDMGKVDEAVAQYRQSLQFDPEDLSAWLDSGDTLLDVKRYDEAIACYQEVVSRESDHPWATATILYARFMARGADEDREALLRLRAEGHSQRASELADEIDPPLPYVTYLPRVGDASANAVRATFEQMFENPAEHHGSTVHIKATHLESPSVVAAFRLQMEMWGPHVDLQWEIENIPQPDPRSPKAQIETALWVFDGVQPRPGVPAGNPQVAHMVFEIAELDFDLESWEPRAERVGAQLGPAHLMDLYGVMVNPPRPPNSDWRVLIWVQRVQVAAALIIAHIDSGWQGSARRQALCNLLYGPVDWVVDAAIIAFGCLARKDPAIRAEVEQAFAWMQGQIPADGFTCFEYPLVSTWIALGGHDEATLGRLKAWEQDIMQRPGRTRVTSSEIKAKPFDQEEEMAKAQAAQEQLAAGGGGDPDPEVFPGKPVAKLSDYVALMRGLQSGDMMGALGKLGLDMASYTVVMQEWGAALQGDPGLNAKFGQMMAN